MQMGKIKSAVITAIVALATLALFLFGVVSCSLPDGVHRYNSILSNIHLGSELSGDAYVTLLPDGVITAEEYSFTVAEGGDKADEYKKDYVPGSDGSFYIDRAELAQFTTDGAADTDAEVASALAQFEDQVAKDAEILSARFGERRYTSYSVSVAGGCAICVSVPTNFTYAAYSGNDSSALTDELSYISNAMAYLTLGGELTLRNTAMGRQDNIYYSQSADGTTATYNILNARTSVADIFDSVSYYAAGGAYAVRVNLTSYGQEIISAVSEDVAASDDTYIRFYVGEYNVINLTCESAITGGSFYIQANDAQTARNYAALLNSVATGSALSANYTYDEVIYNTSASGTNAAMFLAIAALVILVAVMVYAIARYKKLGLVFSLMALLFASAVIAVVYLVGTTLTTAGALVAVLCFAMFSGCNFWSYEAIRRESKEGRTIPASVKLGYKKTFTGILDLHIVLLVISIMLALICTGEAAACGMILLIGTLASYVLHWFTRFMWYVNMAPARDKYKFCGFKREVIDDDE